ncbi:MAG TPA: regulatory iron-sulfur-containing complex subunit RicT, partial [Phycisphaerales bacterium]|nr:regulatory iron-sulfur-containing complex subunit RicT [Phycisphaerales bacterium]
MSIFPLPQFEADVAEYERDREAYEKLSAPKTIVMRFGAMGLIGEYPYDGSAKPGCGSKLVARTHRGTELGEMLTSTCPNAGCSKSVSRQEMLGYIENSGGADFPFFTEGKILRVATVEDMNEQSRLNGLKTAMAKKAQTYVEELRLPMKIVDADPILGGERLTLYFRSEDRIDFRDLVHLLAREFSTRIELRQVGARDEARLIADYEKCGQHCCCKQFLKVLKPISIKSAKTQKATLDPLKISGRCGRLMCCLRYEDQTYDELVKRLPKMKKRVGTPQGIGIVIDRQILTQLVLVRLEGEEGKQVAVPVEEIMTPEEAEAQGFNKPAGPTGPPPRPSDPMRGMSPEQVRQRTERGPGSAGGPGAPGATGAQPRGDRQERYRERSQQESRGAPGGPSGEQQQQQRPPRPPQQGSGGGAPKPKGPVDLAERARLRREQEEARRRQSGSGEGNRGDGAPRPPRDGDARDQDGPPREGGDRRQNDGRRRKRRRRGGGGGGPGGPRDGGPSD